MKAKIMGLLAVALASLGNAKPVADSAGAEASPPLRVALTFDDSLKDHLLIAAPMLEERGWRGTFCIVTDWVGKDAMHLTWDDVRELARRGHEIATHTKSHKNLVALVESGCEDEARREISASADRISAETGVAPRYLFTPFFRQDEKTERICRELGLRLADVSRYNFGSNNCERVASVVDGLRRSGAKYFTTAYRRRIMADGARLPAVKVSDATSTQSPSLSAAARSWSPTTTACPGRRRGNEEDRRMRRGLGQANVPNFWYNTTSK